MVAEIANVEVAEAKVKQSLTRTLIRDLKTFRIEPVLFFYEIGFAINFVIQQNLYIERICRVQLGYSRSECQDLLEQADNSTIEVEVQAIASQFGIYRTIIEFVLLLVFAQFLGPWSDKHGSKIPLLLCISGYAMNCALYSVISYVDSIPPVYMLLASLPISFTGGSITLLVSSMNFISTSTKKDNRSFRFAIMQSVWYLGSPIGTLGGAQLYKALGFTLVYCIASACHFLAVGIGVILIDNNKPQKAVPGNFCADLFDIDAVKDTIKVLLAKREPPKRRWLWLAVAVTYLIDLAAVGVGTCMYLFTRRQFSWTEQNFSVYSTASGILYIVGLTMMSVVGLKMLKANDIFLTIVSTTLAIVQSVIIACAPMDPASSWMIYLAATVHMCSGMIAATTRSILSKIIPPEHLGKVFTFVISTEFAITSLAGGTLYSFIYMNTQKEFAGAFSAFTAGLYVVVLVIVVYLYASVRKYPHVFKETESPQKRGENHEEVEPK